jgi:hypothetical protein
MPVLATRNRPGAVARSTLYRAPCPMSSEFTMAAQASAACLTFQAFVQTGPTQRDFSDIVTKFLNFVFP